MGFWWQTANKKEWLTPEKKENKTGGNLKARTSTVSGKLGWSTKTATKDDTYHKKIEGRCHYNVETDGHPCRAGSLWSRSSMRIHEPSRESRCRMYWGYRLSRLWYPDNDQGPEPQKIANDLNHQRDPLERPQPDIITIHRHVHSLWVWLCLQNIGNWSCQGLQIHQVTWVNLSHPWLL